MDAAASVHSAAHAPLVTAVTVVPTHISTLQSGNLEAPLLSIDVPGLLEQPLGVSEHMLPEAASDEKKKVRLCGSLCTSRWQRVYYTAPSVYSVLGSR